MQISTVLLPTANFHNMKTAGLSTHQHIKPMYTGNNLLVIVIRQQKAVQAYDL